MKKTYLYLLCTLITINSWAQEILPNDVKALSAKEDSLKIYSNELIQAPSSSERFKADSLFTKAFVRALKIPNSFYYPFDSLYTISKLYAPDSSFKIFTWQMVINENVIRQHGAIQMKTNDGSLKLFPLIDKSDVTINIGDTVSDNKGWIGAVYYNMVQTSYKGKNYYTLLGYDEDNIRCTRKIAEVLSFVNDAPIFGGSYFYFGKDSIYKPSSSRFILEFKKDAAPKLNYDKDLGMILSEHLISETGEPKKKWTLIPDGDYEGFKWINGKWVHIEKVFKYITPEGQAPTPKPVTNAAGNTEDSKLKDNTNPAEKNISIDEMPTQSATSKKKKTTSH